MGQLDWNLTSQIVSILGTIGALILGGMGLSAWRRQLRGTAEYEHARKVLLRTYEIRGEIQAVRAPMMNLRKEEVEAGRSLEEEQRVYNERMIRLQTKWAELQTAALEAKVIWGVEAESSFQDLREVIGTIYAEIWLHFWLKGAYASPSATVDRSPERVAANDEVVYFISEDDEFSRKITAAVSRVERFFQGKMRN